MEGYHGLAGAEDDVRSWGQLDNWKERRNTNPARGNGDGFATSRGARPTDRFGGGAADQPGGWCAGQGTGSYRLKNTASPPDQRAGGG